MVYDNAAIRIRGPDAQPNFVIPPQIQKLEGAEVAVKQEINVVVKSEASGSSCDSGDESHLPPPCCNSEATEAMRPNRRFLMNRREKVAGMRGRDESIRREGGFVRDTTAEGKAGRSRSGGDTGNQCGAAVRSVGLRLRFRRRITSPTSVL